jgi:hypothetical protein
MASHMATSYGPQVVQVNEEPASESSLDLTLMQHPRDEDLTPRGASTRSRGKKSRLTNLQQNWVMDRMESWREGNLMGV